MPTKKWTEEEEEFLKENFTNMTNAELAEKYNITKNAVQKKLARMNLKRAEASMDDDLDESNEDEESEVEKKQTPNVDSHFFKANNLYYEEQDYEGALEEYQKAAEEESDELIKLKSLYWMGECYLRLLNLEEAKGVFSKIAKEYPTHYIGDSARRRLNSLENFVVPESY
ncbi:tetratricopeptide repeat protein [Candidatus Poribacteria bacterium]|nr:tetratricopeptide repeat protein [Candidatus Poribacteria bacterium]